jgi:hypothetical protein
MGVMVTAFTFFSVELGVRYTFVSIGFLHHAFVRKGR